jgi:hypothetical protein
MCERIISEMNSHTTHLSPQKRIAPSSDSHGSRKRLATGGGVTREAQEDLAPARLPPRKSSRRLSARGGGGGRGQRAYCGQEHARRHRMPNHRPLPLRSSTTASCATPLPSCHERPVVPLLTFSHSRTTGLLRALDEIPSHPRRPDPRG